MERFYKLFRETTIDAEKNYNCYVDLTNGKSCFSDAIRVKRVEGDRTRPTLIHLKSYPGDSTTIATFDKNNKLSSITTIYNHHATTYIIKRSKDNIIEDKYYDGILNETLKYILDENGYIVSRETISKL